MSISRSTSVLFYLLVLICLCACTVHAGSPQGKNKPFKDDSNVSANVDIGLSAPIPGGMISAGISIGDARHLATRYNLTGSKPLPPGIRKNLARGKPMPPGIAKNRLPDPFIGQLPHHPGYEWQQAGADLVLVVSGSLVISDILEGVFD
jgi:hypothetical protein